MRRCLDWIEQRTGGITALRTFFFEEIPASAGWPQVFGSVALFLFLTQALTGVLLALNYAATPGDAYDSLLYIIRNVTGGAMIRGLHHWGASLMVIVVALHACQVFLFGAYKKPREVIWFSGVLLLLLVLGFGLTGYLLPWDNRAYWGTVVTTQIAGQAPIVGRYLQGLLGAKTGVGVLTFSRFYALHVLVLPALTVSLIGIHLALIRKHGVTPAAEDTLRKKTFFPGQVLRDTVAIFAAFLLLFLAAAFIDAPLDRMADPNDTIYTPRPEWYFLWLFQLLKFFHGPFEAIGSIGLPSLVIAGLVAVPFLDRGRVCKLRQQSLAAGVVLFVVAGWSLLTVSAIRGTPANSVAPVADAHQEQALRLPAEELAAVSYFRQEQCQACHNLVDGEPKTGPNLAGIEIHASPDWMTSHFRNPGFSVGKRIPAPPQLTPPQINALLMLASKVTAEDAINLANTPTPLMAGASVYVSNLCSSCHRINGVGGQTGPSLNGVSSRHSREWVKRHFISPKILSPGSIMPAYRFSAQEEDALVSYLFQLP